MLMRVSLVCGVGRQSTVRHHTQKREDGTLLRNERLALGWGRRLILAAGRSASPKHPDYGMAQSDKGGARRARILEFQDKRRGAVPQHLAFPLFNRPDGVAICAEAHDTRETVPADRHTLRTRSDQDRAAAAGHRWRNTVHATRAVGGTVPVHHSSHVMAFGGHRYGRPNGGQACEPNRS